MHSLHLFRTHRYDLAVDAWIALDITPAKIVALYPEAVSGKLFLEVEAQEELFGGRTRDQVKAAGTVSGQDFEREEDGTSVEEDRPASRSAHADGSPARSSPATSAIHPPTSLSSSPARAPRRGFTPVSATTTISGGTNAPNDDHNDDDAASIRTVASRFTLSGKRSWLRDRDPAAALEEIAEQAARACSNSLSLRVYAD